MSARRIVPAGLAVLAAFAAAPAGAHLTRFRSFSFPATGTVTDEGVAVDQATGDVYVAGNSTANVEKFSASGAPESFTPPGFTQPAGVAVDDSGGPSKGDVYVAEGAGERRVVKLDASGGEVAGFTKIAASSIPSGDVGSEGFGPFGVAVDPANGDVVVEDQEHGEVDIFSESGVFVSQFKGGGFGVAVGSHGAGGSVIFTSGEAGVQEWSPAGGYSTPTTIDPNFATAVAVDLSTGHVFADDVSKIAEYDFSGAPLARFGSGDFPVSEGVAVNEKTNTVYVSEPVGGQQSRVYVYGPPVVLADVVTGTPATNVTSTTASVSGTVNPAETTVTGCRFEYGPSIAYGATSPCSAAPPLTGSATIPEAANLGGLQPNATYHYRLVAVNTNGSSYGEDQTFATPAAPPSLDDQSVSGLTQTSVILDASVNANNQETTYHFDFGSSAAYGTALPSPDAGIGSGYGDVSVGRQLSGLTPGTTYHFRVVATNAAGRSTGVDVVFTTLLPTPPLVSTGAVSGVSATAATISGSVDAQGVQSTYEFDLGVDTGYGTRIFGEAGSGMEPRVFSVSLRELTPGTTYHYRLIAVNVFGVSYGPDETFTTPVVPGALLVGPAATPLIASPPFPEQTAGAASTAKSVAVAKAGRSARARASRSARWRGKWRGRGARGVVRAGHAHDHGRGGR